MLTRDQVSEIKAAQGVYRASDLSRHYGVHRSTVCRIWDGQTHRDVRPTDFPEIRARHRPKDLAEDIRILSNRGMTAQEVADYLEISVAAVYIYRGIIV